LLFFSQVNPFDTIGVPTTSTLTNITTGTGYTQGNIMYVEDESNYYFFDGIKWTRILNEDSKTIVENELFFEDTNFYYVSTKINTTNWMVSRFSKTNFNIENFAMGSGTQPSDLPTITSLTYI